MAAAGPRAARILRWLLWLAVAAFVLSRFTVRASGSYPGVGFRLAGIAAGVYEDRAFGQSGTIGPGDPRAGVEGPEWRDGRLVIFVGELDWIHRGIACPVPLAVGEGGSVE